MTDADTDAPRSCVLAEILVGKLKVSKVEKGKLN